TLKDAKAMARAARKTPAGDSENQCRKAPVFGAGHHHLKPAFSVPDSVTTVPVPESVTTSRLSGPISTARQEPAASERGAVVGCPSSEATGDGKGTRLTEEATAGLSRSFGLEPPRCPSSASRPCRDGPSDGSRCRGRR